MEFLNSSFASPTESEERMDFENNPPILIPETSLNNSNFEQDQSPGSPITSNFFKV